MLKKTASNLSAQKLRLILMGTILLLVLLSTGIFFYTRGFLTNYATDVQKMTDTANASSQNLTALSAVKSQLAKDKESVERAKSLVAESKYYTYQDQIIQDINMFAATAGVKIAGYQFNNETAASTPTSTSAPAASAPGAATSGTATAPAGLKVVSVAVSLKNPNKYENVMELIHMIEQNLTKMQLAGVTMNKEANSNDVTVSSLTIGVYVKP